MYDLRECKSRRVKLRVVEQVYYVSCFGILQICLCSLELMSVLHTRYRRRLLGVVK
jgi:hypothetical protein